MKQVISDGLYIGSDIFLRLYVHQTCNVALILYAIWIFRIMFMTSGHDDKLSTWPTCVLCNYNQPVPTLWIWMFTRHIWSKWDYVREYPSKFN